MTALLLIAALVVVIALTELSIPDLFASGLAFVATGWAILCVSSFTGVHFFVFIL